MKIRPKFCDMPRRQKIACLTFTAALTWGLALLLLTGCATNSEGWFEHPVHPGYPYTWVVVPNYTALQVTCDTKTGFVAAGCAKWNSKYAHCVIYAEDTEANAPKWLREHELKHCRGFTHS